jgi:hypothetical protein
MINVYIRRSNKIYIRKQNYAMNLSYNIAKKGVNPLTSHIRYGIIVV